MTVSSGFFNSVNHDRLYDAEQLSSIFDGIIIDGVYENYGDAFMVTANPEANSSVLIGTGRAWFDHTWTVNDSTFAMQLDPPNEMLGRVDAIVIDVDRTTDVRKNTIIYLKGSEASPSTPPILVNTDLHKQYPLAYITRVAGADAPVQQAQISYQVGISGDCPIVTGVLESQNLDNLWQQLDDEFDTWWDGIKATLDENTVTHLQNQINELKEKIEGDDALVGLLTKPVYEAFKSGDYGLTAVSYSGRSSAKSNNIREDCYGGAMFLPDGSVIHIYSIKTDNSGNSYKITIDLYDTSGVKSTSKSSAISFSGLTDIYDYRINVCPISIDSFPVTILVTAMATGTNSAFGASSTLLTITSGKNISYNTSFYSQQTISNANYNNNGFCSHGLKTTSGNFITAAGSGKSIIVYSRNSEGVLTSKLNMNDNFDQTIFMNFMRSVTPKDIRIKDDEIVIDAGRIIGTPNLPRSYGVIDPNTLTTTLHDITLLGDNPMAPTGQDWYNTTNYPIYSEYSKFNGSEQNGLTENTATNFVENVSSEKISDYFIGASNANISLPEGLIIGINTNDGIVGVASAGNNIFIGNNGGAAILKKTISVGSINEDQIFKWAKGYINNGTIVGYLLGSNENSPNRFWAQAPEYSWILSDTYPVNLTVVLIKKEDQDA